MYGTGVTRAVWIAIALALAVLLFDVLLLAFAGVLFAVFLRGLSDWLSARTRLSPRLALALVGVVLAGLTALAAWKVAPDVAREIDQLTADGPALVENATGWLESHAWGQWLLDRADGTADWLTEPRTIRRAASMVGSSIGLLGTALVILLVGVFVAIEPRPYRAGILRLVPVARRAKAAEILAEVSRVLRAWLLGKVVAMAAIFFATWAGLALLDVPIALTLALLAAALTFIPNVGPILAAIPAVLLALQQGKTTALAVVGLYAGAQLVESYVLTPLIQRKAASLPPAITLLAPPAMGVIAGGVGLLLATPLTAAALTIGRAVTPPADDA